jgi:hypothetical protein
MGSISFATLACAAILTLATTAVTFGGRVAGRSPSGEIRPAATMNVARSGHTATLLKDGTVLIAGGMRRNGDFTPTAETYDPKTNRFTPTKDMLVGRVGAAAALLASGKVLVVGGWYVTDDAEVYDPASRSFSAVSRMNQKRARPTATLLNDGTVLIAGGEVNGDTLAATASAEIFDPRTGKFTPIGEMHVPRSTHTATLMRDGRVLIVGGSPGRAQVTDTAEIFDPKTHTFIVVGHLSVPRYKHAACLLDDGSVLVVGGSDDKDWRGAYDTAEIFNRKKNAFEPAGKMSQARFKLPPEAVLVNGKVVVFGGASGAAIYNEHARTFAEVSGAQDTERFYPSATALQDGRVLLAGGYPRKPPYDATKSAWLYILNER